MIGFVTGAIAGGAFIWFWGDRIRELAQDKTSQARDTVARGLDNVQAAAEGALDTAKEQVRTDAPGGSGLRTIRRQEDPFHLPIDRPACHSLPPPGRDSAVAGYRALYAGRVGAPGPVAVFAQRIHKGGQVTD